MSNKNRSLNLPALLVLLLASTNQDIDKHLEGMVSLAQNIRQAILNMRQGLQTIQRVLAFNTPVGNSPGLLKAGDESAD
ncbi:MAG: hypothetical protein K6U74_05855 [Firmicutes bacterium]|nr:hypothetical protein [Bacillota bacterium]